MPVVAKWDGERAKIAMRAAAADRLVEALLFMTTEVKKTLRGGRSGRMYKVPGTRRRYRASAPGEPPARRLGNLVNSIEWRFDKSELVGAVGVHAQRAPYGAWLEFGHRIIRSGKVVGHVAARPFLRPTFQANAKKVREILLKGWF